MKYSLKKRGFTLIELLVVITIIGLLAGLAVPAINGALDKAKQAGDVANVRQVGLIFFTIANDDSGSFPGHPSDPIEERRDAQETVTLFNSILKNKELTEPKILVSQAGGTTVYTGSLSQANLLPGNIAWDYVTKLTTTDAGSLPLLITKGAVTGDASLFGSEMTLGVNNLWKKKGMVVYSVGNSASWLKINNTTNKIPKLFDPTDVTDVETKLIITTK
jgi:prepilin-type N-terminal cleavage/methylation domain-containing protein